MWITTAAGIRFRLIHATDCTITLTFSHATKTANKLFLTWEPFPLVMKIFEHEELEATHRDVFRNRSRTQSNNVVVTHTEHTAKQNLFHVLTIMPQH